MLSVIYTVLNSIFRFSKKREQVSGKQIYIILKTGFFSLINFIILNKVQYLVNTRIYILHMLLMQKLFFYKLRCRPTSIIFIKTSLNWKLCKFRECKSCFKYSQSTRGWQSERGAARRCLEEASFGYATKTSPSFYYY